jgi:hydroxypyruvate isomerase
MMFTFSCSGGWVPGSFADKIRSAAALGYKAVEPLGWIGQDLRAARAASDETGCRISAILLQSADSATWKQISNEHGMVHGDAKEALLRATSETLEAAQILGTSVIVCNSGNEIRDIPRAIQHAQMVLNLRAAAKLLKGTNIIFALEPLNVIVDHKGYFLQTTAEGAAVVREVDSPNMKLLYDVYHQQITEGNLSLNIRKYINELGHIHVGDHPGRNEPGSGEINYKNIFKTIAETGYSGYVTFECGHTESVEAVTKKMFDLLPQI